MSLNRRALLTAALGAGATLILPPTLAENAEAARRYWALNQTMVPETWDVWTRGPDIHQPWLMITAENSDRIVYQGGYDLAAVDITSVEAIHEAVWYASGGRPYRIATLNGHALSP